MKGKKRKETKMEVRWQFQRFLRKRGKKNKEKKEQKGRKERNKRKGREKRKETLVENLDSKSLNDLLENKTKEKILVLHRKKNQMNPKRAEAAKEGKEQQKKPAKKKGMQHTGFPGGLPPKY